MYNFFWNTIVSTAPTFTKLGVLNAIYENTKKVREIKKNYDGLGGRHIWLSRKVSNASEYEKCMDGWPRITIAQLHANDASVVCL